MGGQELFSTHFFPCNAIGLMLNFAKVGGQPDPAAPASAASGLRVSLLWPSGAPRVWFRKGQRFGCGPPYMLSEPSLNLMNV